MADYTQTRTTTCPEKTVDIHETIAAIATPQGIGGVGIIRVSGSCVPRIAQAMLGFLPRVREATFCDFKDQKGQLLDQGLAIYFAAPHSFTGEAVLELQGHGGSQILSLVLEGVLALGARMAAPGEFLKRAFLNDKIDLMQAEAVADLIEAGSQQAAQAALRTLQGAFSDKIQTVVHTLTQLRVYLEAALDFSEEEINFLSQGQVLEKIKACLFSVRDLQKQAQRGQLLNSGIKTVIIGKPNAGKSSLLNQLVGRNAAIVTTVPGTTRDIVKEKVVIAGLTLELMDTAGLRISTDEIEQEGVARAKEAITQAQLVLCVQDVSIESSKTLAQVLDELQVTQKQSIQYILVCNKSDKLLPTQVEQISNEGVVISAKTGEGITALGERIRSVFEFEPRLESDISVRARHLEGIKKGTTFLEKAFQQTQHQAPLECIAEDLRLAQNAFGEITGVVTSDDLLGEIFSSFCVGK